MADAVKLLDVVAITEDLPKKGLRSGQVGTVVERLRENVFEVEFNDNEGRAYAFAALPAAKLMLLHYESAHRQ